MNSNSPSSPRGRAPAGRREPRWAPGPQAPRCAWHPPPGFSCIRERTIAACEGGGLAGACGGASCRLQFGCNRGIGCFLPLNRRRTTENRKSAQTNHLRFFYYISFGLFYLFLPLRQALLFSLRVCQTGRSRATDVYFKNN